MFQHNPSLSKAMNVKNEGTEFKLDRSFYVDDAAFIFLSREDIERGGKLIQSHFRKFGLTVHAGNKTKKDDKSKMEAMFLPGAGKKEDATAIDKRRSRHHDRRTRILLIHQEIQILGKYLHILTKR